MVGSFGFPQMPLGQSSQLVYLQPGWAKEATTHLQPIISIAPIQLSHSSWAAKVVPLLQVEELEPIRRDWGLATIFVSFLSLPFC